ncbi:MAG: NUDIX domain-containing protein [Dehalococcoidia bacterium]
MGDVHEWSIAGGNETGDEDNLVLNSSNVPMLPAEPLECVAFLVIQNDLVLAERRSTTKRVVPGAIAIPGGHMEPGETPEEAVRRELQEELAIVPRSMRYVCTLLHRSEEFRKLHYFAVEAWNGTLSSHEAESLSWVSMQDLSALDLDVDHIAIREYLRVCRSADKTPEGGLTYARSRTVGLVFEAWRDLDRCYDGVTPEFATQRIDGGSSLAWTLAHVTNQVDAWINVRFQQLAPHPLLGEAHWRIGGTGDAEDWPQIVIAVQEVRDAAHRFLSKLAEEDLSLVIPYDGSLVPLRSTGLRLQTALLRIAAHSYFHLGEVAALRVRLGHEVGDFPGLLTDTI